MKLWTLDPCHIYCKYPPPPPPLGVDCPRTQHCVLGQDTAITMPLNNTTVVNGKFSCNTGDNLVMN